MCEAAVRGVALPVETAMHPHSLLFLLGVILPRETRKFSFIFKAINAGIFTESWEFGTRPVLLGGAMLQVTLWGIAVYEDISADLRNEIEVIKQGLRTLWVIGCSKVRCLL